MSITDIIATIALVVSVINLFMFIYLTIQANKSSKIQALTAQGAFESQIRSMISDATKEMNSYAVQIGREPENEILHMAYYAAEEMYRNAYEDACAKYIDGKIDKERFKKLYHIEVQKLVEDPNQEGFYSGVQSPYICTVKVYREWCRQV